MDLSLWINLATLGVIPIALAVWRQLVNIRENDLKHLDAGFAELRASYQRLEDKLDQHIAWHMSAGKE